MRISVSWLSYSSLIPPNLFILVAMVGTMMAWRRRKRLWLAVATAATCCLYIVAMPVAAGLLIRSTEALAVMGPRPASGVRPAAIIVLSADARRSDVPGVPDTVGPLTLERLAEAARQQRRLELPLLVSGGPPDPPGSSLAAMMSTVLQQDFHVPVRWREERSRNTFENALFSAEILRQAGVGSAVVVAHRWDMARALWSFHAVDYPVVAAPVPGDTAIPHSISAFLPQISALLESYYALHELIGLAWYRFRYGQG